jgi:lipoprotein-anchoring transpeptidase ErfK/SrfK
MAQNILKKTIVLLLLVTAFGCSAPQIPPEVQLVEKQEHNLWLSGAEIYAPDGFKEYRISFRKIQDDLVREKTRFVWFQNYKQIKSGLKALLETGQNLEKKIVDTKNAKKTSISDKLSFFENRIETLKGLTELINEGRLARKDLIKAELLLSEATTRFNKSDYETAEAKLKGISGFIEAAENALRPILGRYADGVHIKKWQQIADETIAESKNRGIPAIIVNKSERTLILYKNGVPFKTYSIGLGRNGSLDKSYAGDQKTPEGKYRITKKLSSSRFHKALLINYPNEEDMRNFISAKRKGLIPSNSRIGGLIEIHGGGKESMTYGCVSMDNNMIDSLFNLVDVGTPVAIVGAIDHNNVLSSAIEGL